MAKGNFIDYVVSDNPNKYPNDGVQSGYYYETVDDVTPEVTEQTPVITQIAENLGVTITTPSGTNKQILQGNNANLLNIKNNAKKEGQYVWTKKRFYTKYPHSLSNLDYYIYVDTSVSDYSKLYFDLKNLPVFPTDIYDFLNGFKIYDQENALRYTLEYVDGVMYANRSRGVTATITVSGTIVYIKVSKVLNWGGTYGHIRYDGEKILYEDNVVGEIVGFVVSDDTSAYPDGAVHTDDYYYELLGQVTSANVMSLSDNAVATVQQDYRDTIETEVSNANS